MQKRSIIKSHFNENKLSYTSNGYQKKKKTQHP